MRRISLSLCLVLGLVALVGCGADGEDGQNGLPCEVSQNDAGETTLSCPGMDPVVIPGGADGAQGEAGESCSAVRDDETGIVTVSCPGSDPVEIRDGEAGPEGPQGETGAQGEPGAQGEQGEPGADGESCTVERDDEAGTTTVSCPDSDPVVIQDGVDGADGDDGAPGADGEDGQGCTVENPDDGTITITCGDESTTYRYNFPPEVGEVEVQPEEPVEGDSLLCDLEEDPEDRDNDEVEVSYQWFRNGEATEYTAAVLPGDIVAFEESWYCEVSVTDGKNDGNTVQSDAVSIDEAPRGLVWTNFNSGIFQSPIEDPDPERILETNDTFSLEWAGDDSVFYHQGGTIYRLSLMGGEPEMIIAGLGVFGLAADVESETLYWSDFNGDSVHKVGFDGSNPTMLAEITSPSGMSVDTVNNKLYFITYNNTRLFRVNLDGTGLEELANNGAQGVDVEVYPEVNKVFYTTRDNDVRVVDLDGSNPAVLITGQGAAHGLALDKDANKLYWAAPGMIRRADLDGSNIEDVIMTPGVAWDIDL